MNSGSRDMSISVSSGPICSVLNSRSTRAIQGDPVLKTRPTLFSKNFKRHVKGKYKITYFTLQDFNWLTLGSTGLCKYFLPTGPSMLL